MQDEQLQKSEEAPAKTANRCGRQTANARESTPALGRIWPQPDECENWHWTWLHTCSEKAMQVKQELNEAKKELREANREVDKAKQEVEKASASVQAGRVRAGASACAVVAVAFDLHSRMVVVRFRGGPPLLLFGVVLSSRQGSPRRQSCLHCVHWGLFGVEGLLAASGFTTKNVAAPVLPRGKGTFVAQAKVLRANLFAPRVLPMLQNGGVNPRLEVWGSACFPLALTGCWCWQ